MEISIHAPPRGATPPAPEQPRIVGISIHAPPRGATSPCSGQHAQCLDFNSRPSARGDHLLEVCPCGKFYFNSRPSARGDGALARRACAEPYFNSRPSARGDGIPVTSGGNYTISIHAPPRGATVCLDIACNSRRISIHAPPRGATKRWDSYAAGDDFNSRPSARGDSVRGLLFCTPPLFQFTPLREGRLMALAQK